MASINDENPGIMVEMKSVPENRFTDNPEEMQLHVRLVLVNGPEQSVQAPRAAALFGPDTKIHFKTKGRLGSIWPSWQSINCVSKGFVYCIDLGFPQAAMAALGRRLKRKTQLVFEIGDPMRPLLKGQDKNKLELYIATLFDKVLPYQADALVFRGTYLRDYFRKLNPSRQLPPSLWLPDGVDTDLFRPLQESADINHLKTKYKLQSKLVVGLVGSIHHSPMHNLFYGWEMVETIARLPESSDIIGVIVGDGPGRPVLEQAIKKYGLENRIHLIGRVPHAEVPLWMNVFDVALSTQTDDPVGWGRTTAKLPEYLACGTPVLCSDVGEAHRLLSGSGQTISYKGMRDESYPEKLAAEILKLTPETLGIWRQSNRRLAEEFFAYPLLQRKLRGFLNDLADRRLNHGDWVF